MQIVVATPYLPYPRVAHGGGQDLMALVRFLGERHTLRVASFADAAQAAHAPELRPFVAELCVVRPAVTAREKLSSARRALRGPWGALGRRADREMRAALLEWADRGQAEALLCCWTEMGRYLAAAPGAVRILDEVDVRFVVEQAAAGRRPVARLRAALRRRQELGYCRSAHLVLTRSARDLARLQANLPGLRGLVLPPVAHVAAFAGGLPGCGEPGRVLFVGAMDRARNQEAARWLVQAVWPQVRAAQPGARLRLVGANPGPAVLELGRAPGVEVTGWVEDLRDEYARARVVVAPMHSEAGALNKLMDALAAGRPVVATPRANLGVGAPAEALCLADDPAAFAQGILRLLSDDAEWQRQARAGRRFAEQAFNWPARAAQVERALIELVRGGSVTTRAPRHEESLPPL